MATDENQLEGAGRRRPMHEYILRGQVDLSQVEGLEPDVPLRIAAVRDDQVIASTVVSLRDASDRRPIRFELKYRLPGRRPCGVHLVIGRGDLRVVDILGPDTVRRWVPAEQWKEVEPGHNPFTANVGSIVIPEAIYRRWLIFCRRYTIRGRVVCRRWRFDPQLGLWTFVDAAVPGATVEAYDVDRWWWFYFKDLIETTVTDVNGYFEMDFWWCCGRWYPFPRPWLIDPDIQRRIRDLIAQARPHGGPLPDPPPDPYALEEYLTRIAGRSAAGAPTMLANRTMATAAPASAPATSALNLAAVLPPAPDLEALRIWPWWPSDNCAPDILLRVTQPCGGVVQVIYEEPLSQTRWDAPRFLDVTLQANDKACCLPPPDDPPCGDCVVFTWAGCTRTDHIGGEGLAGPPDLRGYAFPNSLDRPFAGSFGVRGDFGEDARLVVDYYKLEYRKDGMPPGTWIDMSTVPGLLGSISRAYWDHGVPGFSASIPFGPTTVDGRTVYKTRYKFERDNPGLPGGAYIWDDWDTLFHWDTTQLPQGDGLYTFRLVAYREAADGTLVDERVMPLCGTEDDEVPTDAVVWVRLDNRNVPHPLSTPAHPCGADTVHICTAEPDCDFVSVIKNEGMAGQAAINPCDIVTVADSDTITVHFTVTVPATANDGHLQAYDMSAHYAESAVFYPLVVGTLSGDPTIHYGPDYATALTQGPPGSITRPHWYGGSFKVTLPGSAFPASCAYLLHLRAWKRSTNGCTDPYYFHANVCEFSFCLVKPGD